MFWQMPSILIIYQYAVYPIIMQIFVCCFSCHIILVSMDLCHTSTPWFSGLPHQHQWLWSNIEAQIARFMGPTWDPPGSCRPQMGPMLAPWTVLSGSACVISPSTKLQQTHWSTNCVHNFRDVQQICINNFYKYLTYIYFQMGIAVILP